MGGWPKWFQGFPDVPIGPGYEEMSTMVRQALEAVRQTRYARERFLRAIESKRPEARRLPVFCFPESKELLEGEALEAARRLADGHRLLTIDSMASDVTREMSGPSEELEALAIKVQSRVLPRLRGGGGGSGGAGPGEGGGGQPSPPGESDIRKFYEEFARAYESADAPGMVRLVSSRWRSSSGQTAGDLLARLQSIFLTYRDLRFIVSGLRVSTDGKAQAEASYHLRIEGRLVQRSDLPPHGEDFDLRETLAREEGRLRLLRTEGTGWAD
jgi:hypothetical protein